MFKRKQLNAVKWNQSCHQTSVTNKVLWKHYSYFKFAACRQYTFISTIIYFERQLQNCLTSSGSVQILLTQTLMFDLILFPVLCRRLKSYKVALLFDWEISFASLKLDCSKLDSRAISVHSSEHKTATVKVKYEFTVPYNLKTSQENAILIRQKEKQSYLQKTELLFLVFFLYQLWCHLYWKLVVSKPYN